jgi:hypothetical protein
MESTRYSYRILMKLSRQIFEKKKKIKPHLIKIHPLGAELSHADGYNEANSCFLQFCERA